MNQKYEKQFNELRFGRDDPKVHLFHGIDLLDEQLFLLPIMLAIYRDIEFNTCKNAI